MIRFKAFEEHVKFILDKCKREYDMASHTKYTIRVPSGDNKYRAFWVRDAVMMAESGMICAEELLGYIDIIAMDGQNGDATLSFKHGLRVPAWSVADHIMFNRRAMYYPGNYISENDQGDGTYGTYPPHDNQYYFIRLIKLYLDMTDDYSICGRVYRGIPLHYRMTKAFESFNIDADSGLPYSRMPQHTVDWGFCDSIKKSGLLLFPTLLRYRAAIDMADILLHGGFPEDSVKYRMEAKRIKKSITNYFPSNNGLLYSATEVCRQGDIWGTAFAVWLDAIEGSIRDKAVKALLKAYKSGDIARDGYISHLRKQDKFAPDTMWEQSSSQSGQYQNGGYWPLPIGWMYKALSMISPEDALEMVTQFIDHTLDNKDDGTPWEWQSGDRCIKSGLYYGASAALPYACLKKLGFK